MPIREIAALCLSLMGAGVAPGTPECGPNGEQTTYTRPNGSIVQGTRPYLGPAFGVNNSFTANIAKFKLQFASDFG